jgi:drug/metabolite transporter (DMT)-like permease
MIRHHDGLPMMRAARTGPTAAGFLSILLWGTSIAVGRLAMGEAGLMRGALLMALCSGVVGSILLLARRAERAKLRTLPRLYWWVCGGLFVLYTVAYNLGIGLARDGRQVLVFGMLNYLWPVLTVAFSTLIFHRRARFWLVPGLLMAGVGIFLAFVSRPDASLTLSGILLDVAAAPGIYLLGLACGISWALFSNLGKRIAGANTANPVPLFFLASGLVFLALFLAGAFPSAVPGTGAHRMSGAGIAALAYRALIVDLLAYVLWDAAMRRGDQLLVAAASFCTPLLSTACISLLLGVRPGVVFWAACILLAAGAALSHAGVRGEAARPAGRPRADAR